MEDKNKYERALKDIIRGCNNYNKTNEGYKEDSELFKLNINTEDNKLYIKLERLMEDDEYKTILSSVYESQSGKLDIDHVTETACAQALVTIFNYYVK